MIKNFVDRIKFQTKGILVIDNFLPEDICKNLRDYAMNPPEGYDDIYQNYYGIDFDRFHTSKSLKNISSIIEKKISFLGELKYSRSWCFCYDNKSRGVPAHADPSYLNVNIWVTPDECVNDFNKNGLKIYHKKRGNEVEHKIYNSNDSYILNQIKGSKFTVVPYKYRRSVIFLGSMFHETTGVDMKIGKNNRRVSYTFLYDK